MSFNSWLLGASPIDEFSVGYPFVVKRYSHCIPFYRRTANLQLWIQLYAICNSFTYNNECNFDQDRSMRPNINEQEVSESVLLLVSCWLSQNMSKCALQCLKIRHGGIRERRLSSSQSYKSRKASNSSVESKFCSKVSHSNTNLSPQYNR